MVTRETIKKLVKYYSRAYNEEQAKAVLHYLGQFNDRQRDILYKAATDNYHTLPLVSRLRELEILFREELQAEKLQHVSGSYYEEFPPTDCQVCGGAGYLNVPHLKDDKLSFPLMACDCPAGDKRTACVTRLRVFPGDRFSLPRWQHFVIMHLPWPDYRTFVLLELEPNSFRPRWVMGWEN